MIWNRLLGFALAAVIGFGATGSVAAGGKFNGNFFGNWAPGRGWGAPAGSLV